MLKINNKETVFLIKQRNRVIEFDLDKANSIHIKRLKKIRSLNWRTIFLFASNRRKLERNENLSAAKEYFAIKLKAYETFDNTIDEENKNDS